ncbi:hypothetical protein [Nostoc favosum]|uniref:Uncharacterized protein n=1 Tax=Nostoc favosum CHAB5714 TaxID=2780399 RepID=A0ABS8IHK6_9NOSO|nr:hypothetical protein [Nostoc favosum]MCC5603301.1 hypothetical protein [Nostoc favosum CHAB5714]
MRLIYVFIAVPIQMRYNITSPGVGARHCRAPTGVPHVNENGYIFVKYLRNIR